MVHITEPPDMTLAFNPRRKARNQTVIVRGSFVCSTVLSMLSGLASSQSVQVRRTSTASWV